MFGKRSREGGSCGFCFCQVISSGLGGGTSVLDLLRSKIAGVPLVRSCTLDDSQGPDCGRFRQEIRQPATEKSGRG